MPRPPTLRYPTKAVIVRSEVGIPGMQSFVEIVLSGFGSIRGRNPTFPILIIVASTAQSARCICLFVDACSARHLECDGIWDTNIEDVYGDLFQRRQRHHLPSLCRFGFLQLK